MSAITGWSLTVAAGLNYDYATGATTADVVLGQLRGYPASSSLLTTSSGSTLLLSVGCTSGRADGRPAFSRSAD